MMTNSKLNNSNINKFINDYDTGKLSVSAFNNLIDIHYPEYKDIKKASIKENFISSNQKISIIIPSFNRLEQLNQCIESIKKQTYQNFEIIIIDDCSTDDTNKVYSSQSDNRIKYFRNSQNSGMGFNRQRGFNLSTGNYIIFCDDDDYYIDNNYFADLINIFKDSHISVICSDSYIHYERENSFDSWYLNFNKKIKAINYLEKFQCNLRKPTSTFPVAFRKSILEQADFKNMKMMNDCSIYLRALMVSDDVYHNEKIVGIYRLHEKNISLNVKADFTIKNLEEKKYVFNYIKENNILSSPMKWYKNQIKITVAYFFNSSERRKLEQNKVLYWVKNNVSYLQFLYFKLVQLKKSIIKGKINNENK